MSTTWTATVVSLFSLGNALQAYTIDKTRNSIRVLMELAPAETSVICNGELVWLPVEQIVTGDIIQVKIFPAHIVNRVDKTMFKVIFQNKFCRYCQGPCERRLFGVIYQGSHVLQWPTV